MKRFLIVLAIMLGLAVSGYAQQDPDDPGMQDSLIISSASIDSGQTFVFLQIIAVTDDSVSYYDFSLTLRAPYEGVCFGTGTQYFPPLTSWDDIYDTVSCNPPFYHQFGWEDFGHINLPIYTDSIRQVISTLRLVISPSCPPQTVIVDSLSACYYGAYNVGFLPAFVPGNVYIGSPQGIGYEVTVPASFSLSQNYPNPFNSSTEIQFSLSMSSVASLVIYDIQGREVRRLFDSDYEAGTHSVIWNGTDNSNQLVSSGIYFYKLIAGEATQTNRMTLLR
jgi:hypothetical protein